MNPQIDNADQQEQTPTLEDLAAQLGEISAAEQPDGAQSVASPAADGLPQEAESAPAQESAETEQDAPDAAQNLTVKALAEKLGMDAADLYNGLSIDLGDGKAMTLSEMKHRSQDLLQSEALMAKATANQLEIEGQLMQKRRVLDRAAQRMGYTPTEADIQEDQAEVDAYLKLQSRLAVEYMPEWADEAVKHADQKGIAQLQSEYLFSEQEAKLMIDARLNKVFRDLFRLRTQVNEAAKRYKKPRKPQAPSGHVSSGNALGAIKNQVSSGSMSQDSAITELAKHLR